MVNLKDHENIYIDCQPVEEINGSTQDDTQDTELNNSIFDNITNDANGAISASNPNPGIQITIAITVFAIVYGIGNYIFKSLPISILEKKIDNL